MYTILTSKPGEFRTEVAEGMQAVETWDYALAGRRRAEFVIASFAAGLRTKVKVADASGTQSVNWVPSKFLESFDTLEEARAALRKLASFGSIDITLVKR